LAKKVGGIAMRANKLIFIVASLLMMASCSTGGVYFPKEIYFNKKLLNNFDKKIVKIDESAFSISELVFDLRHLVVEFKKIKKCCNEDPKEDLIVLYSAKSCSDKFVKSIFSKYNPLYIEISNTQSMIKFKGGMDQLYFIYYLNPNVLKIGSMTRKSQLFH
jgi:hypothetical protein